VNKDERRIRAGAKEHRPLLHVREHCANVGRETLSALLPVELAPYGPVRVGFIVNVNVVPSRVLL
jgi:hypothetical protein